VVLHRLWRIAVCDKALIVGPFALLALVPYCSVVLAGQDSNENKTSTSEGFEPPWAYLLFRLISNCRCSTLGP
jgi:hypothetical protein